MKYFSLIFLIFVGALKADIPAGATDLVPRTDSPAAESLKIIGEPLRETSSIEITGTPESALSDVKGSVITPEAAGLSKLRFSKKSPPIDNSSAELIKKIVGSWQFSKNDRNIEIQLTPDFRFVLSEHSAGAPDEVLRGTWKMESRYIVYRVETLNGVISADKEIRHFAWSVSGTVMSIGNQFNEIIQFSKK